MISVCPRQRLAELIGRFGTELCDDPKRCEGLLRDVCGGHRREIFVLVSVVRENAAAELLRFSANVPREVLIGRLTKRLHDNLGLAPDLAQWGVESWALALGMASAKDTVLVASAETTTVSSAPAADEDVLSEFPSASTEDILRQTIRRVLADGIVTDEERAEVHRLRTSLGIASDVAARIVSEVKAEMGIQQPVGAASAQPSVANAAVNPLVSPPGQTSTTPAPVSQASGRRRRAILIGVPVSLCLLIYWLGWKTFFVVVLWILAVPSGLIAIGCGIGALMAKADGKKKELWQIASGLAVATYVVLKLAVWLGR